MQTSGFCCSRINCLNASKKFINPTIYERCFIIVCIIISLKARLDIINAGTNNITFIEIFIDECWVDCFWNARKLYVRRSSNAENSVPGHNDWTDVVSYDTHTVLTQIAPAQFFIELGKFNGSTVEATYEISRLTLTDGGPPDA